MPTASPAPRPTTKGEETEREIPFMKGYTVFNAEQCDDLPAHYTPRPSPLPSPRCSASKPPTGSLPRPAPTSATAAPAPITPKVPDYVQMPPFETFRDAESYAATLAHELTHWTKHDKRLARDIGRVRHGDEGYAREELAALS